MKINQDTVTSPFLFIHLQGAKIEHEQSSQVIPAIVLFSLSKIHARPLTPRGCSCNGVTWRAAPAVEAALDVSRGLGPGGLQSRAARLPHAKPSYGGGEQIAVTQKEALP